MNPTSRLVRTFAWTMVLCAAGCTGDRNFTGFLANEIGCLHGTTNDVAWTSELRGDWNVKRDNLGSAIDTKGIGFEALTNLLTSAYGEPQFYCPANDRHGPTFVYPPSKVGLCIFVSATARGAEVTLTKTPPTSSENK